MIVSYYAPYEPAGVIVLHDYVLRVLFADGRVCDYDMSKDITREIFARLRNKKFFRRVHIERGGIVWNDELDIAPEHVYYEGTRII